MPLRPLETLLAFKALNLMDGLTESDRRVAAVLIEHFNRRTGRCDPSIGRIAKLLSIHRRTVMRSIKHLESAGIIRTHRHGGHSNSNQYAPDWARFEAIVKDWQERFSGRTTATELSLSRGRECHLDGDRAVTQTYPSKNLPKITCSVGHPRKENRSIVDSQLRHPPTLRTIGSSNAMRSAAERRWSDALLRKFSDQPVTYGDIIEAITTEIQNAATDAELRARGGGYAYVMRALGVWTGRPESAGKTAQEEEHRS
jgi:predicted transcriptional regulator